MKAWIWRGAWAVVAIAGAGCGAGRYGFAPEYATYGDEDDYLDEVTETTFVEVQRDVEGFSSATIGWFGVVEDVQMPVDGGPSLVTLSFRTLAPRNLCSTERDGSCRVTVNRREGELFLARVLIDDDDLMPGEDSLHPGSLLKVYGHPVGLTEEGAPVIDAQFYRHWPRAYYRTTNARSHMRR